MRQQHITDEVADEVADAVADWSTELVGTFSFAFTITGLQKQHGRY